MLQFSQTLMSAHLKWTTVMTELHVLIPLVHFPVNVIWAMWVVELLGIAVSLSIMLCHCKYLVFSLFRLYKWRCAPDEWNFTDDKPKRRSSRGLLSKCIPYHL